jgi:FkbM family methyltransferase
MMYVDPKDIMGEMAMGADWETVTTHIFRQVIRPGDVVIDIGAHWGYFTLLAATLCTDAGKVYAFEPHPENFAMLTKNIAANQLSNVVAIQKAISDCQGEARLFQAQASMGHSLYHLPQDSRVAKDSPPVTISISTVRLDDFFAADSIRPRLIKMDIEGAEPSALEGMQGLIKRSSELVLITEFNFQFLDSNTAARFLETLTALGFEIAILDEERVQIKVPPPEEIMGELLQPETGHVINLVCVRGRELTQRLLETQQLRGGRIPAAKVTAHH